MKLSVRVGGVVFNGLASDGFLIGPSGFSGWDDGVDVRRNLVERPQAHGAFDVPGYLGERTISLSGDVLADSPRDLEAFRAQLMGCLANGIKGTITVEHMGATTYASGRLATKPMFTVYSAGAGATYQIQFWCSDPRKYGDSRAFADGTPSFHRGNFPAIPVHTVTGSMGSGYTITGPQGKTFTVSAAVTSGHPHTIDMATGSLTVDGSPVYGAVTHGDTWVVNAGTQVTHTLSGSGGSLSTVLKDTFI